ncbi:MAG: DinB family protein [Acidobacteriota bacterium]
MKEFLQAELDREVERSRVALKEVPEGKFDWKPHEKSMIFGYLVNMVATIPSWIVMEVNQPELDVAPEGGSKIEQKRLETSADLIQALDKTAGEARSALEESTDEHLMTSWRLLAKGEVVLEAPRYEMIQDTINHWAHHRGQMTVYLRLMGSKVPAIYGPSADDNQFR